MEIMKVNVNESFKYLEKVKYTNLLTILEKTWMKHPERTTVIGDDGISRNKYYDMWKEQCAVNLPMLYVASVL